jgi:hypothetical protein
MKKALFLLGAFLMLSTIVNAQRSESVRPVKKETKEKVKFEGKRKVRFNINLAYTTANIKMTRGGTTEKVSLIGRDGEKTSGVYLGVSWDMDLKYGIGLEFCDLGAAYYRSSGSWSEYDYDYGYYYKYDVTASFINVFLSPIKLQYRYAITDDFAVSVATGPSLEYCVSYNSETTVSEEDYYEYEIYSDSSTELPWKSLYFSWDIKASVSYSFLKLTAGTGIGLNNVAKGDYDDFGIKMKVNRPIYVMLSFAF